MQVPSLVVLFCFIKLLYAELPRVNMEFTVRERKIKLIEVMVVAIILAVTFIPRMMDIPVAADEYYWISRSDYLEEWIAMDSTAESWQLNNLTLSGPALPKYIIGVSRLLGGYDRAEMDRPENYTFHYEGEALVGAIPTDKLLFFSRAPMVVLSILIGVLIYCLFWFGINRFSALIWLILYICSPSTSSILLVAMSEAPLLFFSILSFIFIAKGQKKLNYRLHQIERSEKKDTVYGYYALAGISLGLAASSKIHAFLLFATFGLMLLYIIFIPKYPGALKTKITYLIRIFSLFSLSALFTFIILNPSIYTNPIKGVGWMFQYRMIDMTNLSQSYPELIAIPMFQRWIKILKDLLTTNASIHGGFGLYINSGLSILGLYLLLRSIIISIKHRKPLELLPSLMVYLSIMILAAFMSPLDWLRYFLFPLIGVMLLMAYSSAYLFEKVRSYFKKRARGVVSAC